MAHPQARIATETAKRANRKRLRGWNIRYAQYAPIQVASATELLSIVPDWELRE
jgi:hypothetical protein